MRFSLIHTERHFLVSISSRTTESNESHLELRRNLIFSGRGAVILSIGSDRGHRNALANGQMRCLGTHHPRSARRTVCLVCWSSFSRIPWEVRDSQQLRVGHGSSEVVTAGWPRDEADSSRTVRYLAFLCHSPRACSMSAGRSRARPRPAKDRSDGRALCLEDAAFARGWRAGVPTKVGCPNARGHHRGVAIRGTSRSSRTCRVRGTPRVAPIREGGAFPDRRHPAGRDFRKRGR